MNQMASWIFQTDMNRTFRERSKPMDTFRDQDLAYLAKRYDSITETLEWILELLKQPKEYDRNRIIEEVEEFLQKIG